MGRRLRRAANRLTKAAFEIATHKGASKPTYDIWGDTVNVASRLESSGVLGRIQVSEQVAEILSLHGQFEVECRGPIEVKGKGRLTTYLVVTPYDSLDCERLEAGAEGLGEAELEADKAAEVEEEPPIMLEAVEDVEVEELGGLEGSD